MTDTASLASVTVENFAIEPGMVDYIDGDLLDAILQYVPGAPVIDGATFAGFYQHTGEARDYGTQDAARPGHTPIRLHRFVTDDVEGHGRYNVDVFVAPGLARIPDEDEWHLLAVEEAR